MNSIARSCRVVLNTTRVSSVSLSTLSTTSIFAQTSRTQYYNILSRSMETPLLNQIRTVPNSHYYSSDAAAKSPLGKDHFDKLVKNNKVVVFMKGVPDEPRCGFSNAVVQILRMHGVTNYDSHDVLQDENIRQGIKEYSNWPTIPQVYINGEFVGGCDILIEMHKNGELVDHLSKVGIKSALLEKEDKKG